MWVFDIESAGVDFKNPAWIHNDEPKVITVLAAVNRETGDRRLARTQEQIDNLLRELEHEDLGGHNVHGFDIPYIQKCKPWWRPTGFIRDSKIESEMWYPASDLKSKDFAAERKYGKWIDKKLYGRHSLEAWGQRIGRHLKDDFKKRMEAIGLDPWAPDLPEPYATQRAEYCMEDVLVNIDVFDYLEAKFPYKDAEVAIWIENHVAPILVKQTQRGVVFNVKKAHALHAEIMLHKLRIEEQMRKEFPPFYLRKGPTQTPKRSMKRKNKEFGYTEFVTEGEPFTPVKLVEFNPGSRQHIANRLIVRHGWKPTAFTETGDPKIDETVLSGLPYPEAKLLNTYLMVDKRLGMLAEGNQAWFRQERNGRIHGRVNQNGTRTTRASHVNPNLGQVPKVKKKPGVEGGWGAEMRELFMPTPGRKQVGVDLSGIELRALGHYMAKYDGGAYAELVVNGDVHTETQRVIEFNSRDHTKTAEYAYLYGAGDYKLGLITYDDLTAKQREEFGEPTKTKLAKLGQATRSKLIKGLNGMEPLLAACGAASKRGYMRALDGRRISVPSRHSSLNTLLQHLGGELAKVWMILANMKLVEQGLIQPYSWVSSPEDAVTQILWVHDELQYECDAELTDKVAELVVKAANETQEFFQLRVKVDAEAKIGNNWRECH